MPNILIRQVDDQVLERLRARARRSGRSLQAELERILEQASRSDRSTLVRKAAALRRRLAAGTHSDSGELQAQDRAR